MRAWRHRDACRTAPEQWLRTIARREALRQVRPAPVVDLHQPEVVQEFDTEAARRVDVQRAVAALPREDRLLLRGRYWVDLTQAELASRLGMPEGTTKVRLHRLRAKLRTELESP